MVHFRDKCLKHLASTEQKLMLMKMEQLNKSDTDLVVVIVSIWCPIVLV